MTATRGGVLIALHRLGTETTPMSLANRMGHDPYKIADILRRLYMMNKVNRRPHPATPNRYLYRAKRRS